MPTFANPYMPGTGHRPPHLAGREREQDEFRRLLGQAVITENLILSGLRGVGKTSLLNHLKPIAQQAGWLWTGEDFTEQSTLDEQRVVTRIITDLSVVLGSIFTRTQTQIPIGFGSRPKTKKEPLGYKDLQHIYDEAPGLVNDKLKVVLRYVGQMISATNYKGIVFAYDEAQNLTDHAKKDQYPLALLLDVFQSVQKYPGGHPFLLVLTGLPTLFSKLILARTYTERMFHTIMLDRLSDSEARDAITIPLEQKDCPVKFSDEHIDLVANLSGGYPHFIQFFCREAFDIYIAHSPGGEPPTLPINQIIRKMDQNFFAGRWDVASDSQRQFLRVIAELPNCEREFTPQEIVRKSADVLPKKYSISSVSQYLKRLADNGLVYKNRLGKYQFAVPMLSKFIKRQPV